MSVTPETFGVAQAEVDGTVVLFSPKVRFASTNESQFDAMMDWRAELELGYFGGRQDGSVDLGDTPDVFGGYVDFLQIRLGEHDVWDLLDSLSQDAEMFGALFDGGEVGDWVEDDFEHMLPPVNSVLIITAVSIAKALRGNSIGAWLVAEVIARMASATDTLVLMYPHPLGHPADDISELEAVDKLTRYWQRAGFDPVGSHPGFLAQSTAFQIFGERRRELDHTLEHLSIAVPLAELTEEGPPPWTSPRHTFRDL